MRIIALLAGMAGALIGLYESWKLIQFGREVFSISSWDTGRLSAGDPITAAVYSAYAFWITGGLIALFGIPGLIGSLLAPVTPRVSRGLMRWTGVFLLLIGIGTAGLLIYLYAQPRGINFARLISVPIALSGALLFVAAFFHRKRTAQAVLAEQAPLPNAVVSAGTCPNCHKPIKPGAAFCAFCGARVGVKMSAAPTAARQCSNPQCGRIAAADKKFCAACGSPVR